TRDAEGGALPARMGDANAAGVVGDEDRDAVGGDDAEQQTAALRPQRVRLGPWRHEAVDARDLAAVHLADAGHVLETQRMHERRAVPLLHLERRRSVAHAAEGARGEAGDEPEAVEEWRTQDAALAGPRTRLRIADGHDDKVLDGPSRRAGAARGRARSL